MRDFERRLRKLEGKGGLDDISDAVLNTAIALIAKQFDGETLSEQEEKKLNRIRGKVRGPVPREVLLMSDQQLDAEIERLLSSSSPMGDG